jgi:hypothetical protein
MSITHSLMMSFLLIISIVSVESSLQNINAKCAQGLCDTTGGTCIDGMCICLKGYTTYLSSRNHTLCNYAQKSSITAGLLELFFGNGTGHFYAGRSINGLVKLCSSLFFCFSCCCSIFLIRKLEEDVRTAGHPHISFLFIFALTIGTSLVFWQVVDSILFLFGIYYDGNNTPLY